MATVGDGGFCRIPLTPWPPEVKKTPTSSWLTGLLCPLTSPPPPPWDP